MCEISLWVTCTGSNTFYFNNYNEAFLQRGNGVHVAVFVISKIDHVCYVSYVTIIILTNGFNYVMMFCSPKMNGL